MTKVLLRKLHFEFNFYFIYHAYYIIIGLYDCTQNRFTETGLLKSTVLMLIDKLNSDMKIIE